MIKLTDFIINTSGSPNETIRLLTIFDTTSNKIVTLPYLNENLFLPLDEIRSNFKIKSCIIKSMNSYKQYYTDDLYVLDKIGKLLYEV